MENLSNMCICLHGSGARRPPYTHYSWARANISGKRFHIAGLNNFQELFDANNMERAVMLTATLYEKSDDCDEQK